MKASVEDLQFNGTVLTMEDVASVVTRLTLQ